MELQIYNALAKKPDRFIRLTHLGIGEINVEVEEELKKLINDGLISYENGHVTKLTRFIESEQQGGLMQWRDNRAQALEDLKNEKQMQKELLQSTIDSNKSSIRTNKISLIVSIVTLIVLLIQVFLID